MELIPSSEMAEEDTRNTKKKFLLTDAICVKCGVIFNSYFEDDCVICYSIEKDSDDICDHKDFIVGRQSVELRTLLEYHLEELRSLCDLHGLSLRSRSEMTYDLLKKTYPSLDKRINVDLIRKIITRNRKRFWYVRNINDAIRKIKKIKGIRLLDKEECIEEGDEVINKKSIKRKKHIKDDQLISLGKRTDTKRKN